MSAAPPDECAGSGAWHDMRYRVCYGDTDQMGRVYYANYLVFAERARTELLRAVGYTYRQIEADGIHLPVRQCWARYHAPAVYDDELVLSSQTVARGHATMMVETRVFLPPADKALTVVRVELACVDAAGARPRPLPDRLIAAMRRYAAADWLTRKR